MSVNCSGCKHYDKYPDGKPCRSCCRNQNEDDHYEKEE